MLNKTIITKKTGLPAMGQVAGALPVEVYLGMSHTTPDNYRRWTELYPENKKD